MQLPNIIALLVGAAAAAPALTERDAPSGHDVQIKGLAYGGSGCPAGSVDSSLSTDLTTLTIIYDQFQAQAGPNIQPKDYRKNCQLNVKLQFPQGWQFSVFKADYRGYVNLPKGDTGSVNANYYFSGSTQQIMRSQKFTGPVNQNYLKSDVFGVQSTVWSPCGAEGMLNINSAVQITPLDSKKPALLTSDSTDLKFTQIQYLQWRKCKK